MGVEIERKFLVRTEGWRASSDAGTCFRQGYLASEPSCSIRVRVEGERAFLNIKGATVGVTRAEFEYPLPLADAEELLATLCRRPLVEKTRYLLRYGPNLWEIDVFAGDNDGLVVAEVELERPDQPLDLPPWVGEEVSGDVRYYNVNLARRPYRSWCDDVAS